MRKRFLLILAMATSLLAAAREDVIIDDFESGTYKTQGWLATGTAFGDEPAKGTWPGQTTVTGYHGKRLLNTFIAGDGPIGTLTSAPFTIERQYINFRLGGGAIPEVHADLYVNGKCIYRTSPAKQENDSEQERVQYTYWDVAAYAGQQAYIVVVDSATGGWGHINADYFVQSDEIAVKPVPTPNYTTRIRREGDYLQIPVSTVAPCLDVDVHSVDGETVLTHRFRLAEDETDFYMPVYVGSIADDSIDLRISQYIESYGSLDNIYFTSTPEIENAEHPYRPIYHHAPAYGWMNDPNGMTYYNGVYHLFYQYYPYDSHWQMMHWGHATSRDLLHWEQHPVALFPDENGDMFSGSIVVDTANTAGFGKNAFVAIYTTTAPRQAQSIAYSLDEGMTWHKYGAPVLWNMDLWDFRDPKVSWNEKLNCWVMVLAANNDVQFYRSDNLLDWTLMYTWGSTMGQHGAPWECPDLLIGVPVEGTNKTMDVLIVSINPHGPQGGSGTQYFLGEFREDGFRMATSSNIEPRWLDWGKDNYAGVTFSGYRDYRDRPVFIGWMSNWEYAGDTPPAESSFRSSNTFPRALSVVNTPSGPVLKSEPAAHLSGLRSDSVYTFTLGTLSSAWQSETLDSIKEGAYIVELDLPEAKQGWKLTLSNAEGEYIDCSYSMASGDVAINRRRSGLTDFNTNFLGRHVAPLHPDESATHATILVDKSSVEFFVNKGRLVLTDLMFPTSPYDRIKLEPESSKRPLTVNHLKVTKIGVGEFNPNPEPEPEDINATMAAPRVVKRLENGQLVIERDGVRYNALGTSL